MVDFGGESDQSLRVGRTTVMAPFPVNHSGATSDAHLIELWLVGREEQTQRSYRFDATRFLAAVGKSLCELTVADVGGWAMGLEGSDQYNRRRLATVKSLLTFSHETGYHPFNVGEVIRLKKVKRTTHKRIMSESTAKDMIGETKSPRDHALLRFLLASGARVTEAVNLNFSDITAGSEPGTAAVSFFGKGGKSRTVPIKQEVADELLALRRAGDGPNSPVFRTKWGKRLTVRTAQRIAEAARTEVEASPHWFRHCHATTALENGCPLPELQSQLGHAQLSTTGIYVHIKGGTGSGQYVNA